MEDEELQKKIDSMLRQPAQTPMPRHVAEGVLEAILSSDKAPAVPIHTNRKWWLMAASIAILILVAGYFWNRSPVENSKRPAAITTATIQPGSNKATLTLADGRTIPLDGNLATALPVQGHTTITMADKGVLSYHAGKQATTTTLYNTITTPNGGQYQVVLPDGSKVWLNAASSIRFPTAFNGDRKITMTGEAYFEVAENKQHPFIVQADTLLIQVLGTHFNIKAYANDGATKTTLLSGSLKANNRLLKPGQAYMHGAVVPTNTDHDIAWKNGLFNLAEADFKDFMRQVERWYNIKVQYEGAVPDIEFQGKLNRAVPLSDIMDYLKNLGVDCQLKGQTVFVK